MIKKFKKKLKRKNLKVFHSESKKIKTLPRFQDKDTILYR